MDMEKEELKRALLRQGPISLVDKIGMILSNSIDHGGDLGGMISVRNFNEVAENLIYIFNLSEPNEKLK